MKKYFPLGIIALGIFLLSRNKGVKGIGRIERLGYKIFVHRMTGTKIKTVKNISEMFEWFRRENETTFSIEELQRMEAAFDRRNEKKGYVDAEPYFLFADHVVVEQL